MEAPLLPMRTVPPAEVLPTAVKVSVSPASTLGGKSSNRWTSRSSAERVIATVRSLAGGGSLTGVTVKVTVVDAIPPPVSRIA